MTLKSVPKVEIKFEYVLSFGTVGCGWQGVGPYPNMV